MTTDDELSGKAREELEGFLGRIESLIEERAEIAEKIKSEYAAAAASGFDKVALKQIIKDRQADQDKTITFRAVVDTYRRALARSTQGTFSDWARGWISEEARTKPKEERDPKLDEFLKSRAGRHKAAGDDDARPEA